jgi:hypothetical protein
MGDDERLLFDWRRDQWNAAAEAMGRIKEDEQRWLSLAVLIFGGINSAFILGDAAADLQKSGTAMQVLCLIVTAVVVHLLGAAWTYQALTLRAQYYRAMSRLFAAAAHLASSEVPRAWSQPKSGASQSRFMWARAWAWGRPLKKEWAKLEEWRKSTTPLDSKLSEMIFLCLLTSSSLLLLTFQMRPVLTVWCMSAILCVMGMLWPFVVYPLLDRWKLSALWVTPGKIGEYVIPQGK